MKITTLKVSLHADDENAVFGEHNVFLEIQDDAAGGFLVLSSQDTEESKGVKLTMEELEMLTQYAKGMLKEYQENGNED